MLQDNWTTTTTTTSSSPASSAHQQQQLFLKNLKHLNECRSNLKRKSDELKRNEPQLERFALPNQNVIDLLPFQQQQQQQCLDGTPIKGMKCLYEAARCAQPRMEALLKQMVTAVGNSINTKSNPELRFTPKPQVWKSTNKLEEPTRTQTKVQRKRERWIGSSSSSQGLGSVYDVVKCHVLCYASFQIQQCLDWLIRDNNNNNDQVVRIVQAKNRFLQPTFCNYSDVIVHIAIPLTAAKTIRFHVCEVRFHHWELFELQQGMIGLKSAYLYFRDHFEIVSNNNCLEQHIDDMNRLTAVQDDDADSLNWSSQQLDSILTTCRDVNRLLALAWLFEDKLNNNERTLQILNRALYLQEEENDEVSNSDSLLLVAVILTNLGRVLVKLNKPQTAVASFEEAYQMIQSSSSLLMGPDHHRDTLLLWTLEQKARVLATQEEAHEMFRTILSAKQAILGSATDHDVECAMILLCMARTLTAQGKYRESIAKCHQAMTTFQKYGCESLEDDDDDLIVDTLVEIARAYREEGKNLKMALSKYQEAYTKTKRKYGMRHERFADIAHEMALVQLELGSGGLEQERKAHQSLESALSIYQTIHPPKHPKIKSVERHIQRLEYSSPKTMGGRPKLTMRRMMMRTTRSIDHEEELPLDGGVKKSSPRTLATISCKTSWCF